MKGHASDRFSIVLSPSVLGRNHLGNPGPKPAFQNNTEIPSGIEFLAAEIIKEERNAITARVESRDQEFSRHDSVVRAMTAVCRRHPAMDHRPGDCAGVGDCRYHRDAMHHGTDAVVAALTLLS